MRNDDIIQSIRYMLDLDDIKIAHILKLRDYTPRRGEVEAIFEKPDAKDGKEKTDCSDELMAHFLDGLIYYQRGKSKDHPPRPIKTPVTNNMVLKKLRVAFKLHEEDMHDILESAGFSMSKHELSALFRSKGHTNYRECGDQVLRYFLKGLTMRVRD
ncbi:DUF1456 family protein [Aliifodinibius sp. S!AR15-10]|uniref:DUF1456 family protein n=1 Tax=Aliifodinibius sp. S!AR15-10 TaxID=2950437 RepID=UPI00285E9821|nr:DUF1456 family protein [Aliifodinibius sp. S!AR15-10]MDR8393701.1 DUF1456 family protein [Aliifodinibius sp. S!AR15-10]